LIAKIDGEVVESVKIKVNVVERETCKRLKWYWVSLFLFILRNRFLDKLIQLVYNIGKAVSQIYRK
jgi:hypothetical protein